VNVKLPYGLPVAKQARWRAYGIVGEWGRRASLAELPEPERYDEQVDLLTDVIAEYLEAMQTEDVS
jgi:hypothetical protein